jgi:hypothetical protein
MVRRAQGVLREVDSQYLPFVPLALERIEHLARAQVGEPVLLLAHEYRYDTPVPSEGGYLRDAAILQYNEWCGWEIMLPVNRRDFDGHLFRTELNYSTHMFVRRFGRPEGEERFIVGSAAVGELLSNKEWPSLNEDGFTPADLQHDIAWLRGLDKAYIPMEQLGLTDEQRVTIFQRLVEYIITETDNLSAQIEAFRSLKYLAHITTHQERQKLLEAIGDQMAALLPIDPADSNDAIQTAAALSEMYPPPRLGVDGGETMKTKVRSAAFLADLYDARAQMLLADPPEEQPSPVVVRTGRQALPAPQRLHILKNPYPTAAQVAADIAYLQALYESDAVITDYVERDYEGMEMATRHILRMVGESEDLFHRVRLLKSLELLYDIQTDEQRDEFYRLLCERSALPLMARKSQPIRPHIHTAEAIAVCMPSPPLGVDAPRTAQMAAVMGHIWRRQAFQHVGRDIRRYVPVPDGEEDPTTHEEVI